MTIGRERPFKHWWAKIIVAGCNAARATTRQFTNRVAWTRVQWINTPIRHVKVNDSRNWTSTPCRNFRDFRRMERKYHRNSCYVESGFDLFLFLEFFKAKNFVSFSDLSETNAARSDSLQQFFDFNINFMWSFLVDNHIVVGRLIKECNVCKIVNIHCVSWLWNLKRNFQFLCTTNSKLNSVAFWTSYLYKNCKYY